MDYGIRVCAANVRLLWRVFVLFSSWLKSLFNFIRFGCLSCTLWQISVKICIFHSAPAIRGKFALIFSIPSPTCDEVLASIFRFFIDLLVGWSWIWVCRFWYLGFNGVRVALWIPLFFVRRDLIHPSVCTAIVYVVNFCNIVFVTSSFSYVFFAISLSRVSSFQTLLSRSVYYW